MNQQSPGVPTMRNEFVDGAAIVLATFLLAGLFFSLPPLDFQLKLALLSVVLLAWWRLGGLSLLLFLQLYLFTMEPAETSFNLDWSCVVMPALSLILIAVIERSLAARRNRPKSNWKNRLAGTLQSLQQPFEQIDGRSLASLSTLFAGVMGSVVIAYAIQWLVPLNPDSPFQVRLRPTELRGIVLATLLVGFSLGISVIIGELKWRGLTASQARVYLRGHLANWLETQWRTVVRYRIRMRRKMSKRSRKSTLPSDSMTTQNKPTVRTKK